MDIRVPRNASAVVTAQSYLLMLGNKDDFPNAHALVARMHSNTNANASKDGHVKERKVPSPTFYPLRQDLEADSSAFEQSLILTQGSRTAATPAICIY